MKKLAIIFCLLPLYAFDSGKLTIRACKAYQSDCYFKEQVYVNHNWKSFYTLPQPKFIINPEFYDIHLLNACLFYATNKLRVNMNRKPLAYSINLTRAAATHTHEMVTQKFFGHYNPINKQLYSPWMRINLFGDQYKSAGENCALDYTLKKAPETYLQVAEKIIQAWYDSPGHRKNMLSNEYSRLGCAGEFVPTQNKTAHYIKATQDFSGD